jgi:hypothetical protein
MSKPVIGLLLGAFLGLLDGISSFFYPDVRAQMMLIITFSTIKGLITGLIAGIVARKWNSLPLGIATGLIVGLFLAYLVSPPPDSSGNNYYINNVARKYSWCDCRIRNATFRETQSGLRFGHPPT